MSKFKVGDKVVYSKAEGYSFVTLNKTYDVLEVDDNDRFKITDDDGDPQWYREDSFAYAEVGQKYKQPASELRPKKEHDRERMWAILRAMESVMSEGKAVPQEWIGEFSILNLEM